eukprot:3310632-Prorocentrum_lima.AAC.1
MSRGSDPEPQCPCSIAPGAGAHLQSAIHCLPSVVCVAPTPSSCVPEQPLRNVLVGGACLRSLQWVVNLVFIRPNFRVESRAEGA